MTSVQFLSVVKWRGTGSVGRAPVPLTNRTARKRAMANNDNSTPEKCLTIISRAEAKAQGLLRYFNGKPCKHGHVCERRVANRQCLECHAAWHANNKELKSTTAAAWRANNKERKVATDAAWAQTNPDKRRQREANRRARKCGVPGKHTAAETVALLEAQGFTCNAPHCDANLREVSKHLDHINPLSRKELNPTNDIENLQWLCAPCNDSKGAKTMEEWLEWLPSINKGVARAVD